ncbi:hypothetical protein LHP98_10945 [Rhodobacter sp. Har01]|nr:hypothetical protein [Rhodobacter sp. Har01]MCB6178644.1 hypothetical protein [Rhodobacter sp. Har01]
MRFLVCVVLLASFPLSGCAVIPGQSEGDNTWGDEDRGGDDGGGGYSR